MHLNLFRGQHLSQQDLMPGVPDTFPDLQVLVSETFELLLQLVETELYSFDLVGSEQKSMSVHVFVDFAIEIEVILAYYIRFQEFRNFSCFNR